MATQGLQFHHRASRNYLDPCDAAGGCFESHSCGSTTVPLRSPRLDTTDGRPRDRTYIPQSAQRPTVALEHGDAAQASQLLRASRSSSSLQPINPEPHFDWTVTRRFSSQHEQGHAAEMTDHFPSAGAEETAQRWGKANAGEGRLADSFRFADAVNPVGDGLAKPRRPVILPPRLVVNTGLPAAMSPCSTLEHDVSPFSSAASSPLNSASPMRTHIPFPVNSPLSGRASGRASGSAPRMTCSPGSGHLSPAHVHAHAARTHQSRSPLRQCVNGGAAAGGGGGGASGTGARIAGSRSPQTPLPRHQETAPCESSTRSPKSPSLVRMFARSCSSSGGVSSTSVGSSSSSSGTGAGAGGSGVGSDRVSNGSPRYGFVVSRSQSSSRSSGIGGGPTCGGGAEFPAPRQCGPAFVRRPSMLSRTGPPVAIMEQPSHRMMAHPAVNSEACHNSSHTPIPSRPSSREASPPAFRVPALNIPRTPTNPSPRAASPSPFPAPRFPSGAARRLPHSASSSPPPESPSPFAISPLHRAASPSPHPVSSLLPAASPSTSRGSAYPVPRSASTSPRPVHSPSASPLGSTSFPSRRPARPFPPLASPLAAPASPSASSFPPLRRALPPSPATPSPVSSAAPTPPLDSAIVFSPRPAPSAHLPPSPSPQHAHPSARTSPKRSLAPPRPASPAPSPRQASASRAAPPSPSAEMRVREPAGATGASQDGHQQQENQQQQLCHNPNQQQQLCHNPNQQQASNRGRVPRSSSDSPSRRARPVNPVNPVNKVNPVHRSSHWLQEQQRTTSDDHKAVLTADVMAAAAVKASRHRASHTSFGSHKEMAAAAAAASAAAAAVQGDSKDQAPSSSSAAASAPSSSSSASGRRAIGLWELRKARGATGGGEKTSGEICGESSGRITGGGVKARREAAAADAGRNDETLGLGPAMAISVHPRCQAFSTVTAAPQHRQQQQQQHLRFLPGSPRLLPASPRLGPNSPARTSHRPPPSPRSSPIPSPLASPVSLLRRSSLLPSPPPFASSSCFPSPLAATSASVPVELFTTGSTSRASATSQGPAVRLGRTSTPGSARLAAAAVLASAALATTGGVEGLVGRKKVARRALQSHSMDAPAMDDLFANSSSSSIHGAQELKGKPGLVVAAENPLSNKEKLMNHGKPRGGVAAAGCSGGGGGGQRDAEQLALLVPSALSASSSSSVSSSSSSSSPFSTTTATTARCYVPPADSESFTQAMQPQQQQQQQQQQQRVRRGSVAVDGMGDCFQDFRSLRPAEFVLRRSYSRVGAEYAIDYSAELGSGQFGVTRRCVEIATGNVYACKTIDKQCISGHEDAEDIRKEVACLELLRGHPTIVIIRSSFEDAKSVHIVTELCTGGDLFDRVRTRGRLSEQSAARVTSSLVEALLHCHCHGIVHRDVKPENILLQRPASTASASGSGSVPGPDSNSDTDSDIKLIDFGVSTSFRRGETLTDAVGTPEYMAPEVLRQRYGPEADVWSAGVVLYVTLSGAPPFWATKDQTVVERILYREVAFKKSKWGGVSEEAKDLVARMLEKDPKKRIRPLEILEHPWIRKWKRSSSS